jgi:hypothetical protein
MSLTYILGSKEGGDKIEPYTILIMARSTGTAWHLTYIGMLHQAVRAVSKNRPKYPRLDIPFVHLKWCRRFLPDPPPPPPPKS